jgi:hypothetical protein
MGVQLPGPVCRFLDALGIDSGTMCRSASPPPGPHGAHVKKPKTPRVSATVPTAHVLKDPDSYIGSIDYANADGHYECAAFPQNKLVAAAPVTATWRLGAHVEPRTTIAKGTWVATFLDGKYQGHVGAFVSMDVDGALTLIDQFRPRNRVDKTTYHVKKQPFTGKISNDPSKYYVVLW